MPPNPHLNGTPSTACVVSPSTAYEAITQIGYRPDLKRLEAVVELRESSGDSDELQTGPSHEYVRFYLSFDGGTRFWDCGLRDFEVADTCRSEPAWHVVSIPFDVAAFVHLARAGLLRARVILSWAVPPPPNQPKYIPFWGNVLDSVIHPMTVRLVVPQAEGALGASDSGILRIVRRSGGVPVPSR